MPSQKSLWQNPVRQGQSDIKCYACGAFGHISRNCPRNRQTGSEEAHGKPTQNPPNRLGTQVAAVVREQELQVKQDRREQQTCDTQRQERELEGTLDQVAATMHGLSTASPFGYRLPSYYHLSYYECWLQRNRRRRPQNSGRMKCDRS